MSTKLRRCPVCPGRMVYETRRDEVWPGLPYRAVWRDSTGWWCLSCGEAVFDGPELMQHEEDADTIWFTNSVYYHGLATELVFDRDPGCEIEVVVEGKTVHVQPRGYVVPELGEPSVYVQSIDHESGTITYGPRKP